MTLRSSLALLALGLAAAAGLATGCAPTQVALAEGPREYVATDYEQILQRWTRTENLFSVSELESFLERERRFMTQPGSLILPVAMSGTAHFPREMQERQAASFQQWAVPFQHFRQSSSYHDFLTAVNRFCEPLIARIENAPPWSPDFPIVRRETVAAPDAPVLFPRL